MKHWIEFIEKRSHKARRLGKLVNSYDFEILDAENQLAMYQDRKRHTEKLIYDLLRDFYPSFEALEEAVQQAKEKADQWNAEPLKNHKPQQEKT